MQQRVQHIINSLTTQFHARTITEGKKHSVDYGVNLQTSISYENVLWLSFTKGEDTHHVTIPLPYVENSISFIRQNEVVRALCPFWVESEQVEIDYLGVMYRILLGDAGGYVSPELVKATPFLQQIIYGFSNGNTSVVVYKLQKAINEVVNKMPLHETDMNSYVMNNRLMIIDPEFNNLTSPAERLEYQVNKAKKYFERGWTAIGLSDGTLADKNYILKTDLRKYSPFGIYYHNPQRNLYATLGMKGDELPQVRSESMQRLMDNGITRKGWNLFTAFVDIPDIFEDQIIVDISHKNKMITNERRYQVYGILKVNQGTTIKTGSIIGYCPDQEPVVFDVVCDTACIKQVTQAQTVIGGQATRVYNVIVSYRQMFTDAFKITNLHGNKGVIRLMSLGYAVDPRNGNKRKIDVIVGAKTVGKRKNYGQIMEALVNCLQEADTSGVAWAAVQKKISTNLKQHKISVKSAIFEDGWQKSMEQIEKELVACGYNQDGTWKCDTYAGKVKAICGTVFWGCIKTPQDQIWSPTATTNINTKGVRTAGLKFSHVEFRAIETRFGPSNPILDEIMSYSQGAENIHELLCMLRSKMGEVPQGKPTVPATEMRAVDQAVGTIVPGHYISGTIVDEYVHPDGFAIKLPLSFQSLYDEKGEVVHEGSPAVYEQMSQEKRSTIATIYETDTLYIPAGLLRKCWRHDTGKYGLSDVGVLVNNVVHMTNRLCADFHNPINHQLYYNSLWTYFHQTCRILSTKRGEIATHGMSIRYPFSAKAVATLSTTLPKNTIEIHRDMAKVLNVHNGDVVMTERFPCLGFMSVRPQKVRITDDPLCRFTIRVSGNSLVSQNLDFDGDVLFIASFHTLEAKKLLTSEWANPNKTCYAEIQKLNDRKGKPHIKEYKLADHDIRPFPPLSNSQHAEIVEKNTGVKAQTGPVIALTYNLMRIVENSELASDRKMKVAVEMFLEKAAQSVFEQKHGGKSLYDIVTDCVCTVNIEGLVSVGFKRGTTEKLCKLIEQRANAIGIMDLPKFHAKIVEQGGSNVISRIVKEQNKIYFASRSQLECVSLLKALDQPAVDIPSRMYKWSMAGKIGKTKTVLDDHLLNTKMCSIKDSNMREACETLVSVMTAVMEPKFRSLSQRIRETNRKVENRGIVYGDSISRWS